MISQERLQRMQNMSGEGSVSKAPRFELPLIMFDGNTGKFNLRSVGKDNEEISGEINIVILRQRSRLEDYNLGLSSIEYNSTTQKIKLFERGLDGKYKTAGVGTSAELRQQFPTIKTQVVLYVLYNNQICRLTLKGSSLSSFYDYREILKSEEKHSFAVVTKLSAESFVGQKIKKSFFKIKFEHTDIVDEELFTKVEASMKIVSDKIAEIDSFNSSKLMEESSVSENKIMGGQSSRMSGFPSKISPSNDKPQVDDLDEITPDSIDF